jgi:hypothetical protein
MSPDDPNASRRLFVSGMAQASPDALAAVRRTAARAGGEVRREHAARPAGAACGACDRVLLLASPQASYTTGQVYGATGGRGGP